MLVTKMADGDAAELIRQKIEDFRLGIWASSGYKGPSLSGGNFTCVAMSTAATVFRSCD